MPKVRLIVNAKVSDAGQMIPASPATEQMIRAFKQAVIAHHPYYTVEVVANARLWANQGQKHLLPLESDVIDCPLTISLPEAFDFPAYSVFQACQYLQGQRQWVETTLGLPTHDTKNRLGDLWLPIILTQKGPIYGEVIGEGVMPNSYEQPVDLSDEQRQPLYQLGYQLLEFVKASPAVYLLQFSLIKGKIIFDRLWPFPAAPAIASLGIQQPDLFTCHWRCLTGQPILEVMIANRQVSQS